MMSLHKRVALVTGASRGIGARVAFLLAERGADVVINYRSKGSRAEEIAETVRATGRNALLAQADITNEEDLQTMRQAVVSNFSHLDILVLNASGGLEKDKPAEYAMQLNKDAQIRTVEVFSEIMRPGGCIVFITCQVSRHRGQFSVLRLLGKVS